VTTFSGLSISALTLFRNCSGFGPAQRTFDSGAILHSIERSEAGQSNWVLAPVAYFRIRDSWAESTACQHATLFTFLHSILGA